MKTSIFAGVLLISLCQLSSGFFGLFEDADKKFAKKYIMASNQCTQVMMDREFAVVDKHTCKPEKTFIRATVDEARAVCAGRGSGVSEETFKVVECKLDPANNKPPNCQYTGEDGEKKILVTCNRDKKPTEFQIQE
ncbi:ribonuclease pancreatic A-like [Perca fluviatilis]|uniref:ribonuclease pancreatic A-like n=1 Tax=Perca fluviatilis TaxID=8168 RepID=UPI0019660C4D|nr:ribonuclease pancreatic A-like [Perca fluviatilis]